MRNRHLGIPIAVRCFLLLGLTLLAMLGVLAAQDTASKNSSQSGPATMSEPAPSISQPNIEDARLAATQQSQDKRLDHRKLSPAYQRATGIFLDRCSACHGDQAYGDGPWHTEFHPQPANVSLVNDSPAMLRSIVVNGIAGTMMPSFPDLDNKTIDEISMFIGFQPADLSNQWEHPWELQQKLGKGIYEKDIEAGKQVFATSCVGCHGDKGDGTGVMAKVETIWPKPANLTARSSDTGRIFFLVTNGRQGTFMPPQKDTLPELSRWRVSQYAQSLYDAKSQAAIQVPKDKLPVRHNPFLRTDPAAVGTGKTRFDLWCAPCHADGARGSFLAPRLIDRHWKYSDGTDTAVFTVVQQGVPGKLMVGFQKLSEEDRWKIITYIRSRGGLPDPLATDEQGARQRTAGGPGK